MPTLNAVKTRREVVAVPWGQEELHVTYHAGEVSQITPEEIEAWQAKGKELEDSGEEDAAKALTAQMVVRFGRDWDLYEDDAQTVKYPLDVEHVAALDPELNLSIVFAILLDYREKKANGTLSRLLSDAQS